MSSYARATVRITKEKQKENSHEGIKWSEMENKMYKLKRSIYRLTEVYLVAWLSDAGVDFALIETSLF